VPGRPVRLCAPRGVAGVGHTDPQPPPTSCGGITATGVDLNSLARRMEQHGTVQGTATLTGIYRDHALTVTRQEQPKPTGAVDLPNQPPCRAPAGGWPSGAGKTGDDSVGTAWEAAHPGAVLIGAIMRPLPGHIVMYALVGADHDPAAVRAAWQPFYKDHLCVYQSRYTYAEVRAAYDGLRPPQAGLGRNDVRRDGRDPVPASRTTHRRRDGLRDPRTRKARRTTARRARHPQPMDQAHLMTADNRAINPTTGSGRDLRRRQTPRQISRGLSMDLSDTPR
jgi:hypothetical protein